MDRPPWRDAWHTRLGVDGEHGGSTARFFVEYEILTKKWNNDHWSRGD